MSPNPLFGWLRFASLALVVVALLLATAVAARWRVSAGPPVVDAGDLAADPGARLGSEVVVTGEWVTTAPSEWGCLRTFSGSTRVCPRGQPAIGSRLRSCPRQPLTSSLCVLISTSHRP